MKGAVLKRVPGSGTRPAKKKKDTTKLCVSPPKILFRDPIGHELPPSLQNFRWNVDKVERKLHEKIQEKTLIAGNFVYQQAYRLLEGTRGEGIDFPSFREQLRVKFGIILDDTELHLLFDKYDEDGNGTIDMHEFIRRVLPPDYNYGRQWFEVSQLESEDKAARLRHEARQEFLACQGRATAEHVANTGAASNWTIEQLMKQIQAKVVQKTPSGEDQYRRAFKMLRSGRDEGIRMSGLQFNLKTKFGIYASDEQMRQLFLMCDQDGNGEIDLREFLQFVDPPAYPTNSRVPGGLWTRSDSEDEDEASENGGVRGAAETSAAGRWSRPPTGPPSVRGTPRRGSAYSVSMEDGGNPATSTPTRVKKERPRTADPRKTHMLQQRREMVEQQRINNATARQGLQPTCSMSMGDIHSPQLEALSLASGQGGNCARPIPRLTSTHTPRGVRVPSEADTASLAGRSDRTYTPRPRSAGSVRSYTSSSVGSVSSSIKGAAYMKRPPTPQTLRQKCLESRGVSAATASEAHTEARMNRASLSATQINAAQRGNRVQPRYAERRHSYSEISSVSGGGNNLCNCACANKEAGRYVPRVVHVHAKQSNARPYTPEGRVLRRSKVLSSGCL
ncbi:hypothetical protein PHYPSEUDO_012598 [Phytophthora pseudosyringae]|uniref:EF-hand domain-containing protein n=1 Tax=Phytophthora pseudosyringae TaxID=221518 RepID=A0A8T1W879_9STRA|nr:hypothetical protein PHYPSEUDO_012598 [Phytophthora pseudosyringae]